MKENYIVYVKTDEQNRVTEINSSAFLADVTGWVAVDEGCGDKYHHAQGNYLPGALADARGLYCYKLADGKLCGRTAAELEADASALPPSAPSESDRVSALEAAVLALMEV